MVFCSNSGRSCVCSFLSLHGLVYNSHNLVYRALSEPAPFSENFQKRTKCVNQLRRRSCIRSVFGGLVSVETVDNDEQSAE